MTRPQRLSALALACMACTVQAQDRPATAEELDTVVVTASAVGQILRDAPASISVISREDLLQKPVIDLRRILGTVEGVTLQRSGNLAPPVQLRGQDPAYTLILVDGKRVNSTSASFRGNDYDTGWVPAEMIERI